MIHQGNGNQDEEIKRVDEFDSKAACNIAKGKYYVFYAYEWPGYDSKGKYYTLRFQIMERKTVTRAVLKYILTER